MAALDADLCQVGTDGHLLAGLLGEDLFQLASQNLKRIPMTMSDEEQACLGRTRVRWLT